MRRSRLGFAPLAPQVAAIARPLLRGRRFPLIELQAGWRAVVGERLAAVTAPFRLAMPAHRADGGTLTLKVAGGPAAVQVLHQAPLLIERCNTYLGWPAVARLKLAQGPLTDTQPAPGNDDRCDEEAAPAAAIALPELASVADERLRAVLTRLARRAGR
jgi:hypothetical protein